MDTAREIARRLSKAGEMWFKCGCDLLQSAVFRDVKKVLYAKENKQSERVVALIYLFAQTADGRADDIQDAEDLARVVGASQRQAELVWDICLKHGVLKKNTYGYSAREWMTERGILGDTRTGGGEQPPQPQTAVRRYSGGQDSKNLF